MTDRLKPCPFCGAKLTKDRWGIFEHEANECILAYYEVYDEDLDKWNTRKPMDRIVEALEEGRNFYLNRYKKYLENEDRSAYESYEDAIEIVKGDEEK